MTELRVMLLQYWIYERFTMALTPMDSKDVLGAVLSLDVRVYGSSGNIGVDVDKQAQVNIWTLDGRIVADRSVSSGLSEIPVTKSGV